MLKSWTKPSKTIRQLPRLPAFRNMLSPGTTQRRRRQVTRCVFCNKHPVTKEHIWPSWAHQYLPKRLAGWRALHAVEHFNRTDIFIESHTSKPYDFTVKCVDAACNNGWMNNLEKKAAPIIIKLLSPNKFRLTEAEQATLATWTVLKAIIQEYAPYAARITHHTQRRQLRLTQTISKTNYRIWIANFAGAQSELLWVNHPFTVLPDKIVAKRKNRVATFYNSQSATYIFGHLLIHILRSPYGRAVRDWQFPSPAADKLRQIWPPSGLSILWPPPPLTDQEAEIITQSFKNFFLSIVRKTFAASLPPSIK